MVEGFTSSFLMNATESVYFRDSRGASFSCVHVVDSGTEFSGTWSLAQGQATRVTTAVTQQTILDRVTLSSCVVRGAFRPNLRPDHDN